MTQTTVSSDLGTHPLHVSRLAAVLITVALFAALVVGSFALGRSTADTTVAQPAVATATPPAVATAAPPAAATGCVHVAHTPPC